jgi:hypothetical protein
MRADRFHSLFPSPHRETLIDQAMSKIRHWNPSLKVGGTGPNI